MRLPVVLTCKKPHGLYKDFKGIALVPQKHSSLGRLRTFPQMFHVKHYIVREGRERRKEKDRTETSKHFTFQTTLASNVA